MLPEFSTLLIFITAALVLLITPGPAVIYITAQSIDQGTKAGIVSTLGISLGSLIHIIAAALGLSTVLVTSATAFTFVKYIGAGYLIILGIKKFFEKEKTDGYIKTREVNYNKIFKQGILVNLLNPKTALFFFAFLPQFVDPASASPTFQMIFLGLIFTLMAIISDGIYALLAGKFSSYLKKNTKILKYQKYFTGSVYILLGTATALSGSKNK